MVNKKLSILNVIILVTVFLISTFLDANIGKSNLHYFTVGMGIMFGLMSIQQLSLSYYYFYKKKEKPFAILALISSIFCSVYCLKIFLKQ